MSDFLFNSAVALATTLLALTFVGFMFGMMTAILAVAS